MRAIGALGGAVVAAKPGHMAAIGRAGGKARRKKQLAAKGAKITPKRIPPKQDPPPVDNNPVAASIDKMLAEIEG